VKAIPTYKAKIFTQSMYVHYKIHGLKILKS